MADLAPHFTGLLERLGGQLRDGRGELLLQRLDAGLDELRGGLQKVVELRDTGSSAMLDQGLVGGDAVRSPTRAPNAMDDILIEELELGVRSYNCLKRAGIQTVGDLVSKSEGELNAIPNFGKKSIDEVIETLHARGLGLRDG